jgi:K+:H+ antiporter
VPILEPTVRLFLQLTVILATCRAVGWLGRRFLGQTQVVMEMVAGVLLGPSLLGLVAPAVQSWIFPREMAVEAAGGTVMVAHPSMAVLYALSRLGLVLYMFHVGLELDLQVLRRGIARAGVISAAGIVAPFVLGGLLALELRRRAGLFGAETSTLTAVLYLGVSMSITAFPVLARILHERGLSRTRLGTLTLSAGAIGDAVAWCLLALVLATFKASPEMALLTFGGVVVYLGVMLGWARPRLARLERGVDAGRPLSDDRMTLVLLVLMVCALVTYAIGVYAVFGAFIAGVAMPRGRFAQVVTDKIEGLTISLLLPVFFVYSGLNTKIALVNTAALWAITAAVILLASLGKGAACTLAARLTGETWRHAAIIGTLMNARGLMELIILNIGLEQGVISPTLFTIMVLMAVVTTLAASPLYSLLARHGPPD